jgi:hypothetical protein
LLQALLISGSFIKRKEEKEVLDERGIRNLKAAYTCFFSASLIGIVVGLSLFAQRNVVAVLLGAVVFTAGVSLARFYHGRLRFMRTLEEEGSL